MWLYSQLYLLSPTTLTFNQTKMRNTFFIIVGFLSLFLFWGCEEEITLDLPEPDSQVVVEGFIENGQPPFVILTRNAPYFAEFNFGDLSSFLVKGATVSVSDGETEYMLGELEIPVTDTLTASVYTTLALQGEEGKTYTLTVEADGKTMTSTTTIPNAVPIDTLYFENLPNLENDSMLIMYGKISDPDTLGNFYRFFTQVNDDDLIAPFNSVGDDLFINGTSFTTPIFRAQRRTEDIDPNTFGYFHKGDTATIKICSIDAEHYEFWLTMETQLGNQGSPFASPSDIVTNIEGGYGVWGGYGAKYYTIIVPEDE